MTKRLMTRKWRRMIPAMGRPRRRHDPLFMSDYVSERRWRQWQQEHPTMLHLTVDQAMNLFEVSS